MEDDYDTQNKGNESMESESMGATDKPFKEATPEEVKSKVKETVQKGVAAVAGALKGFSEEARKHDLANSTKEAISKAGETTRQVVGTTAQEVQKTKEHVKSSVKGGTASGVGSMGGSSTMGGSSMGSSNVRGTSQQENAMQDVSDAGPKNKAGDVAVPDLRKTDMGKTDEQLEE